jgi:hypothetical protein
MEKDDTSDSSSSLSGNGLPTEDFLSVLEMFEDMQEIESHHNCFTKELLSHRNSAEGNIIFYLIGYDGEIQVSITFPNRNEEWSGKSMYYQADIDFKSTLFKNLFSQEDFEDISEIFSSTFIKVMPGKEHISLKLRIPSDNGIRSVEDYPNTKDDRKTGIQLTITRLRQIAAYFQDLENSQQHINELKESISI